MVLPHLEYCVPLWPPHLKDRTGIRTDKASEKDKKEIQRYIYRMASIQGIIHVTQEAGTQGWKGDQYLVTTTNRYTQLRHMLMS